MAAVFHVAGTLLCGVRAWWERFDVRAVGGKGSLPSIARAASVIGSVFDFSWRQILERVKSKLSFRVVSFHLEESQWQESKGGTWTNLGG